MKGFSFSLGGSTPSSKKRVNVFGGGAASTPPDKKKRAANVFALPSGPQHGDRHEGQPQPKKAREGHLDRNDAEDEVDALDLFMTQVEKDASAPSTGMGLGGNRIQLDNEKDNEGDDVVGMFVKNAQDPPSLFADRPEDVVPPNIPVLEPINHSNVNYPAIRPVDVSSLVTLRNAQTVPKILEYLREHNISVSGAGDTDDAVMPYLTAFDQMLLPYALHSHLTDAYPQPTLIQQVAIPFTLSGRDIIGIAPTGSGKSGIFLWTLIALVSNQQPSPGVASPQAIVIVPTRELASQLYKLCNRYCNLINGSIKCMGIFGNTSNAGSILSKSSPEIVIATPGRLLQFIKKKFLKTKEVRYFIVDEADKLLSMGFEEQLNSIVGQLRPDRQTLFCSATFPNRVMKFANNILKRDRVQISVGLIGAVNKDIVQIPVVLNSREEKYRWLTARLDTFLSGGSVVVFVNQRVESEQLAKSLQGSGFTCVALHGQKTRQERQRIFFAFTSGTIKLLVATDIASRGLDVSTVNTIVQYEPPKNIDTYTHRVGRCGRAGREGHAYSLLTRSDLKLASILFKSLHKAKQAVPEVINEMSRKYQSGRGGGGGRKRRGVGWK